jgi:hypothetical protein
MQMQNLESLPMAGGGAPPPGQPLGGREVC